MSDKIRVNDFEIMLFDVMFNQKLVFDVLIKNEKTDIIWPAANGLTTSTTWYIFIIELRQKYIYNKK